MTAFAALILDTRHARNLGVREAAARAGMCSATFSRIENGSMPSVLHFRALVRWAGVDPQVALDGLDGGVRDPHPSWRLPRPDADACG